MNVNVVKNIHKNGLNRNGPDCYVNRIKKVNLSIQRKKMGAAPLGNLFS